jgi:hypothetical protein
MTRIFRIINHLDSIANSRRLANRSELPATHCPAEQAKLVLYLVPFMNLFGSGDSPPDVSAFRQ